MTHRRIIVGLAVVAALIVLLLLWGGIISHVLVFVAGAVAWHWAAPRFETVRAKLDQWMGG